MFLSTTGKVGARLEAFPPQETHERMRIAGLILEAVSTKDKDKDSLDALESAIIAVVPMETLQKVYASVDVQDKFRHFIHCSMVAVMTATLVPSSLTCASCPGTAVHPSQVEARKCLERDGGKCILTGSADAVVCPIVPVCPGYNPTCPRKSHYTYKNDFAYNLLTLSPDMYTLWKNGAFGLRATDVDALEDVDPNGTATAALGVVHIQFVWLPLQRAADGTLNKNRRGWRDAVPKDRWLSWVQQWEHRPRHGPSALSGQYTSVSDDRDVDGGFVDVAAPVEHPPILSGTVFSVTLPTLVEAKNMRFMLESQWTCQKLASLCGGAGNPAFYEPSEWMEEGDVQKGGAR